MGTEGLLVGAASNASRSLILYSLWALASWSLCSARLTLSYWVAHGRRCSSASINCSLVSRMVGS